MIQLRIAASTDVGLVRSQNEDAYLVSAPLVAVADGMGGHNAGEVASGLALDVLGAWRRRPDASPERLADAVREANRAVWSRSQEDPGLRGMGTTLTAAWIEPESGTVTLAHVGDSRAYLLRGKELSQLTVDQTVVQDMVSQGEITEDEAASHPYRHVLQQALGVEPVVQVDTLSTTLQPGDRLLLATDGLHIPPERIRDVLLERRDPEEACSALVQEANAAGGEDNVTVVLVEAVGEETGSASTDPAMPVTVYRPPAGLAPAPRRARRLRLALAAAAVVGLAVVAALVALPSGPRYQVGLREGMVTILAGGKVVERTDIPADRIASPTVRDSLRRGIPFDSLKAARQYVAELVLTRGPTDTPSPPPTVPTTVP